jgi:hypothetical protein
MLSDRVRDDEPIPHNRPFDGQQQCDTGSSSAHGKNRAAAIARSGML